MTENHLDLKQFDDITLGHLRSSARDARLKAETAHRTATERYEETMNELKKAQENEELVVEVIRRHAASQNGAHARVKIAGDNLREVLIINFADTRGVIHGINATTELVRIGYYASRETADGAVYTTLSKKPFSRVDRGVYHIPLNHPEWIKLRERNGHRPLRRLAPSEQAELDVVVAVARNQNGYIRHGHAKHLLAQSGLFKSGASLGFAVRRVLTHSERFYKEERGLYHLVESAMTLN